MPTVERFEDLDVWQRSKKLANQVYDITEGELFKRDFVSRDQIRRAVVSVMSNIAEGFESKTQAIFIDIWHLTVIILTTIILTQQFQMRKFVVGKSLV